jgi:hypothetical protein
MEKSAKCAPRNSVACGGSNRKLPVKLNGLITIRRLFRTFCISKRSLHENINAAVRRSRMLCRLTTLSRSKIGMSEALIEADPPSLKLRRGFMREKIKLRIRRP